MSESLPLAHLDLDVFYKMFSPAFCSQLRLVYFCGNYGDPNMHPNLLRMVDHLKAHGVKAVSIFTNGNALSKHSWAKLAQAMSCKNDQIIFAIDGLEDTHHLYRYGANWKRIISNAQTFISAGGRARWDLLLFEHNIHQVREICFLAKELGFQAIKIKKTKRFQSARNFFSKELNELETSALSLPKEQKAKDQKEFLDIIEKYGSHKDYFQQTPISCRAKNSGSIFLDFSGKVWPCCWIGSDVYADQWTDFKKEIHAKVLGKFGSSFNSLKNFSLEAVLQNNWFAEQLSNSWNTSEAFGSRLSVCGKVCGKDFDFSSGEKSAKNFVLIDLKATYPSFENEVNESILRLI